MDSTFTINVLEVIDDLENAWRESNRFENNPTAFTKKRINEYDIEMCCPYHNETRPSFGISTKYPYPFNCFSCGASGNIISLVSYIYDINYLETYRKILNQYSVMDFSMFNNIKNDKEGVDVTEEEIFNYRKKKHSYMEYRGISDYTLQKYEIGYDEKNYAITFPVRDIYGKPSFIIRRSVANKFYSIPKDANKKEVLYGLNYLYGKAKKVYIVEGMMDVLSAYEAKLPAVGIIGRTLLKKQLKLLQTAGIEKVVLFLDNDKSGVIGNLDAYKFISTTPIKISVVQYPKERWGIDTLGKVKYKDPNDLLRGGVMNKIKEISFLEFYYNLLNSRYSKEVFNNGKTKGV